MWKGMLMLKLINTSIQEVFMLKKIYLTLVIAAFFINYSFIKTYSAHHGKDTLIENTGDPATEDFRRDSKKKYVGEVQYENNTKRYVGDVENDEVENSKRRGTQKRYVNTEEEEQVFFKKEKDNTFEYDYEEAELETQSLNDARYDLNKN